MTEYANSVMSKSVYNHLKKHVDVTGCKLYRFIDMAVTEKLEKEGYKIKD